jgi:CheY-specific phosphatase CheX
MVNTLDELLSTVAEEMFEDLAFVLIMPDDEMPDDESVEHDDCPDGATSVASIAFHGPFRGTLFLTVSEESLPMIAANMLGLKDCETATQDEEQDAFKELLNVVCGNLLPRIAGVEAAFDVSRARLLEDDRAAQTIPGQSLVGESRFNLELGWAKLALFIDEEARDGVDFSGVPAEQCAATEE